jgi:hypothetical protein
MTRPGDGGELDTRGVAWSGGRAAVTEPCDRAVVGRERARVCPVARWLYAVRSRASRSAAPPRTQVSTRSGRRKRHVAWRGCARFLSGAGGRAAGVGCARGPAGCFAERGAWHCWGCGAAGGAYDAALACGRQPREGDRARPDHPPRWSAGARWRVRRVLPLPPSPRNHRSAHHEPGAPTSRELAIGEQELAVGLPTSGWAGLAAAGAAGRAGAGVLSRDAWAGWRADGSAVA